MENGAIWPDNNGNHINAHGGGVIFHNGRFYWYGEHKRAGWEGRLAYDGVHCYSSTDLQNWQDDGLVLKVVDDFSSPICKGCRIERPKVIHNRKTGKFVMWFHSTDADHTLARSGVAVADKPLGPFKFLYAKRPDAGIWPLNVTAANRDEATARETAAHGEDYFPNGINDIVPGANIMGRDFAGGQMSRDMNLFVDDDGAAYHIHASEHNSTLHIARLTDDYLDHSEYVRVFEHRWMEAPAMFKEDGRYYLLMSGCTGWDPNAARGAVADNIFGPWREIGNPCKGVNPRNGMGPEKTYGSQSTCILTLPNCKRHIAMFDLWNPKNFIDSRYLWLPINISSGGYEIYWADDFGIVSE